jgi:hypothetical protein
MAGPRPEIPWPGLDAQLGVNIRLTGGWSLFDKLAKALFEKGRRLAA